MIYFRLGGLARGPWRDIRTNRAVAEWYENPVETECARMILGDIAKLVGLKNDAALNGQHVEIRTSLQENEVPESDGVRRRALRYGVEIIGTGWTGYVKPENLEPCPKVTRRAVELHLFGEER